MNYSAFFFRTARPNQQSLAHYLSTKFFGVCIRISSSVISLLQACFDLSTIHMPRAGEMQPLMHAGSVQEKANSFRADLFNRTPAGDEHIRGPSRPDLRALGRYVSLNA